ncbi:hypothetical protein, partial [Novosphingobium sp. SG720]|uniref:hypothetical protein n=1 Tax=Novosphingobium sp. SG720 TaxID=2586998 RepID=UPI001B2FF036
MPQRIRRITDCARPVLSALPQRAEVVCGHGRKSQHFRAFSRDLQQKCKMVLTPAVALHICRFTDAVQPVFRRLGCFQVLRC